MDLYTDHFVTNFIETIFIKVVRLLNNHILDKSVKRWKILGNGCTGALRWVKGLGLEVISYGPLRVNNFGLGTLLEEELVLELFWK